MFCPLELGDSSWIETIETIQSSSWIETNFFYCYAQTAKVSQTDQGCKRYEFGLLHQGRKHKYCKLQYSFYTKAFLPRNAFDKLSEIPPNYLLGK